MRENYLSLACVIHFLSLHTHAALSLQTQDSNSLGHISKKNSRGICPGCKSKICVLLHFYLVLVGAVFHHQFIEGGLCKGVIILAVFAVYVPRHFFFACLHHFFIQGL